MENKFKIVYVLIGVFLGIILGVIYNHVIAPKIYNGDGVEVKREVFYDTIPYIAPPPKDSVFSRTDIVRLPVVNPTPGTHKPGSNLISGANHNNTQSVDTLINTICVESPGDSATVAVPITQYEFSDSTYNLKVSGFNVAVDELKVFPRREVVTIKEPPNRWHLGLSAGYGITPKGMQPIVALTLTYSLFSF